MNILKRKPVWLLVGLIALALCLASIVPAQAQATYYTIQDDDNDGDGVNDDVDNCPTEDAQADDANGDGCLDSGPAACDWYLTGAGLYNSTATSFPLSWRMGFCSISCEEVSAVCRMLLTCSRTSSAKRSEKHAPKSFSSGISNSESALGLA